MPNKEPSLDEIAIFNGILTPEQGAQQKVSFTDTAAQSAAFKTDMITIFCTEDAWLTFGSDPTAAANNGNATFLPASLMRSYRTKRGDKLSVIRDTTSGDLHINGGA